MLAVSKKGKLGGFRKKGFTFFFFAQNSKCKNCRHWFSSSKMSELTCCLMVTRQLLLFQTHPHSTQGVGGRAAISPSPPFLAGKRKHSQILPAECCFLLIGQNDVTWGLFTETQQHFFFFLSFFVLKSRCHLWVRVVHNRNNTNRERGRLLRQPWEFETFVNF